MKENQNAFNSVIDSENKSEIDLLIYQSNVMQQLPSDILRSLKDQSNSATEVLVINNTNESTNNRKTITMVEKELTNFVNIRYSLKIYLHALSNKIKSTKTIAAKASTIGTALGTTQGSWRPFPCCSMIFPSLVKTSCFCSNVATGLKATRK